MDDVPQIAVLSGSGLYHRFPPHRVPYRANLWALRSLGVRQVLAPCAVGSLSPDLRSVALDRAREAGWPVTDGGTMVVVEGPRFSTRAESQWFARQGWSVVDMTGRPEAVLARELALCYTALVADRDGLHPDPVLP